MIWPSNPKVCEQCNKMVRLDAYASHVKAHVNARPCMWCKSLIPRNFVTSHTQRCRVINSDWMENYPIIAAQFKFI